jgi:choline dehydrogenase-like flavoprotein
MGTTRMHRDETLGVVDKHCEVHGINGLYVAGSSVFPTAGFANPTLNIVALSLRLADRLKKVLQR